MNSMSIQPLASGQIEAAKAVVVAGCMEFFGHPPLVHDDLDENFAQYTPPSGAFLVLMDRDRVVGTGCSSAVDATPNRAN